MAGQRRRAGSMPRAGDVRRLHENRLECKDGRIRRFYHDSIYYSHYILYFTSPPFPSFINNNDVMQTYNVYWCHEEVAMRGGGAAMDNAKC